MKTNSKDYRVRPGAKVKLNRWPTKIKPVCKSKKQYKKVLEEHVEELSSWQQLHYASNQVNMAFSVGQKMSNEFDIRTAGSFIESKSNDFQGLCDVCIKGRVISIYEPAVA